MVEIADSGKGFSAEAMHKAFDPFYTSRNVGLGLGLTVANRIIQAHAGRIEIANFSSAGGAVRIVLPLAKPVEAGQHADRQAANQALLL